MGDRSGRCSDSVMTKTQSCFRLAQDSLQYDGELSIYLNQNRGQSKGHCQTPLLDLFGLSWTLTSTARTLYWNSLNSLGFWQLTDAWVRASVQCQPCRDWNWVRLTAHDCVLQQEILLTSDVGPRFPFPSQLFGGRVWERRLRGPPGHCCAGGINWK